MDLPESNSLDIQSLSRIFDTTTESYKFFWFGSLLDKIVEGKEVVTFNEIMDDMIASAWYMVSEYHLNLGPKDTMERLILGLRERSTLKSNEKKKISSISLIPQKIRKSKKRRRC